MRRILALPEEFLVAERGEHGVLPLHRRLERSGNENVALHDPQVRVLKGNFRGVARERGHLVALLERQLDQLTSGPAGRADDEKTERSVFA